MIRTIASVLLITSVASAHASAHDLTDSDAQWYLSLKSPSGVSCCNMHRDCEEVDSYRPATDSAYEYDAKVHGELVHVPRSAILERADNPTGRAVVCVIHLNGILLARCFVRPSEG